MSLRFVDLPDPDASALAADQMFIDNLGMAERESQRLTSEANGTAAINQQIVRNLVEAGQRPVA